MIFEDPTDQFLYHHHSLESPELRPISLPMPGYEKSSLDGVINLQAAATAFPGSNAFAQYQSSPYDHQFPNQLAIPDAAQDSEPEYYSDNDFCYPVGYVENGATCQSATVEHAAPINSTISNAQMSSQKPLASSSPKNVESHNQSNISLSTSRYPVQYVGREDMYLPNEVEQSVPVNATVVSSQQSSRKRKASPSSDFSEFQTHKKIATTHLQVQEPNADSHDISRQNSPYSTYVSTPTASSTFPMARASNNSPRPSHQYSTSNASQVSLAAPSPHTPAWSPSFTTVKTDQSPRAPMTPLPRPASTSSPYVTQHPKLVRTSTIPSHASPGLANAMGPGLQNHSFNPYAMFPHNKATLRLKTDLLDAIALDWSKEELEARRKLIVFNRSQTGSIVDVSFETVAPQDWTRSDITINCIWWKEKKEAFVTSVDTISLLEQLVAVRFTVEEKNRIRRNLEGFRPLTVSKAKPDSEDFFKVIMGFPNPKPRNIEKDVKVFPWKILGHALKKIIGKYSASYSSTASAMMTPANSTYASTENSTEYHCEISKPHELMSNVPQNCNMPMTYFHPNMVPGRVSAPVTTSMTEFSPQVPAMGPSFDLMQMPQGYSVTPMGTHPMHMPPHPASAPQSAIVPTHYMQPAWGYDQFGNHAQSHRPCASAPVSAYPRDHIETADLVTPVTYQSHHQ